MMTTTRKQCQTNEGSTNWSMIVKLRKTPKEYNLRSQFLFFLVFSLCLIPSSLYRTWTIVLRHLPSCPLLLLPATTTRRPPWWWCNRGFHVAWSGLFLPFASSSSSSSWTNKHIRWISLLLCKREWRRDRGILLRKRFLNGKWTDEKCWKRKDRVWRQGGRGTKKPSGGI